jgi:hypothetical protein
MLFKIIHFLLCLMSHITYHALHTKMSSFDQYAVLDLRYLNSSNIVNPEQVRSWTFQ